MEIVSALYAATSISLAKGAYSPLRPIASMSFDSSYNDDRHIVDYVEKIARREELFEEHISNEQETYMGIIHQKIAEQQIEISGESLSRAAGMVALLASLHPETEANYLALTFADYKTQEVALFFRGLRNDQVRAQQLGTDVATIDQRLDELKRGLQACQAHIRRSSPPSW